MDRQLALILKRDDIFDKNILYDYLRNIKYFGGHINYSWSNNRLKEEHSKQVREIIYSDIEEKSTTPLWMIYETEEVYPYLTERVRFLNSEKEICYEGMSMDHCVYTNYFCLIKNHEYLALHVDHQEYGGITVGYRIHGDDKFKLDQMSGKRNKLVPEHIRPEVIKICEDFLTKRGFSLYRLEDKYYDRLIDIKEHADLLLNRLRELQEEAASLAEKFGLNDAMKYSIFKDFLDKSFEL